MIKQIVSLKDREINAKLNLVIIKMVGTLAYNNISVKFILDNFGVEDLARFFKSPKTENRRLTLWALSNLCDEDNIDGDNLSNTFVDCQNLFTQILVRVVDDKLCIRVECLETLCRICHYCDLSHLDKIVNDYKLMELWGDLLDTEATNTASQILKKTIDLISVLLDRAYDYQEFKRFQGNVFMDKAHELSDRIEVLLKHNDESVYRHAYEFIEKWMPYDEQD